MGVHFFIPWWVPNVPTNIKISDRFDLGRTFGWSQWVTLLLTKTHSFIHPILVTRGMRRENSPQTGCQSITGHQSPHIRTLIHTFSKTNLPNSMLLDSGRKPTETMGEHAKLNTDSKLRSGSSPEPWSAEAATLPTFPPILQKLQLIYLLNLNHFFLLMKIKGRYRCKHQHRFN